MRHSRFHQMGKKIKVLPNKLPISQFLLLSVATSPSYPFFLYEIAILCSPALAILPFDLALVILKRGFLKVRLVPLEFLEAKHTPIHMQLFFNLSNVFTARVCTENICSSNSLSFFSERPSAPSVTPPNVCPRCKVFLSSPPASNEE